jgi:anthranilate phosphoribosyltransferase
MIKDAIATAAAGREVPPELMEGAIDTVLRGEATPAQIGALLVALRMKGESVAEVTAAARVMRRHCVAVPLAKPPVLLDTCGTGGDLSNTFNISTAAAIVIAGCDVSVAKHGNRAATSKAGSADVLEVLGVHVELSPGSVARCIERSGIGFMFARRHHPAMRHVGPARSEIGVRTLFNFLGPLCNPAGASHQLIGVPERRLCEMLAGVLRGLGTTRAWVVWGDGGLDELSLSGPTYVAEVEGNDLRTREVTPEDFGVARQTVSLQIKDAAESAGIIKAVLAGERGPHRDAVLINAAAGLYVAEAASSLKEAAARAAEALDSGAALRKLESWARESQAPG